MDDERLWCGLNKGVKMLPDEKEKKQSQKKGNRFKNLISNLDYSKLLLTVFCLLLFVILHESTHALIYREYSCNDIKYKVSFKAIETNADCSSLSIEQQNDVMLIQGIAEIIHYPMIFFLGLLLMLYLPGKKS